MKQAMRRRLTAIEACAVVAGVCLLPVACGLCGNRILSESVSPDHQLKAIVFERDCGATTGFSTQVSVLESSQNLPNEPGNVFIADGVWVEVAWKGERQLMITYPSTATISAAFGNAKSTDVSIEYVVRSAQIR